MTNDIKVNVAPGAGRIARRELVVLFDPSGESTDLIESFDAAATDDEAIIAVKQHLIDAQFENAPVVVIDWRSDGLGLIVFGDVVVRSSTSAAPMMSGAGSGTWIERHLGALELGDATEAQVWCDGDDSHADGAGLDSATDLRSGVVRGGGVRVVLARVVEPPPAEIPPPEPEDQNPRPVPAPAPAVEAEAPPESAPLSVAPTNGPAPAHEAVEPDPTSPPVAVAPAVPAPSTNSPFAPPPPATSNGNGNGSSNGSAPSPAVAPGFVAEPNRLVPSQAEQQVAPSGSVATAVDPFTDSHTDGFEDQVTEPAGSIEGLDEIRSGAMGLVEASSCVNGHANPPQSSICRSCAVEIDPDAAVDLIAQPSVGHLRFANGTVVEIDGPQVIGRKPVPPDGVTQPVVIDHAEVSRTHVQIAVQGWAVLVSDVGSRNGTWVIPPSDPTPVKLDADVPYLLEHGTTVHLGGPEASFTYDFGID